MSWSAYWIGCYLTFFFVLSGTFYLKAEHFLILPWKVWQGWIIPTLKQSFETPHPVFFLSFFFKAQLSMIKWPIILKEKREKKLCLGKKTDTFAQIHSTWLWTSLLYIFCHEMKCKLRAVANKFSLRRSVIWNDHRLKCKPIKAFGSFLFLVFYIFT